MTCSEHKVVSTLSDAIIVAVIAALGSIIGQWLISRKQNQDRAITEAERETKLEMRLQSVEKKLDEHNGYAKRFEEIGKDIAIIKTKLEKG